MKIRVRVEEATYKKLLEASTLMIAFLIPALLRWVPEALFPYPIGYDTPVYMAYGKLYAGNQQLFPLLYRVLGWMYAAGLDLLVVMKYLPTILYGFLGAAVYYFSRSYLEWGRVKSLLATLFFTFTSVSLRISWDMHKQVLSTVFLFSALSQLKKVRSRLGAAVFIALSVLTAASYQVIFILLLFILAYQLVIAGLKAVSKREIRPSLIIIFIATVVSFTIFTGLWYGWRLQEIYSRAFMDYYTPYKASFGDRWWWGIFDIHISLFLLCFSFIIPLAVLGYFSDGVLTPWLTLGLIGFLSVIIHPWKAIGWAIDAPRYFIQLLAYPFSFYLLNALDRLNLLNLQILGQRRLVTLLMVFIVVNVPTWSFLGFTPPLTHFGETYQSFPRTMALSSIPLEDIKGTIECVRWFNLNSNSSVIIVHWNYRGWVGYYRDKPLVSWGRWHGRINEAIARMTLDEAIATAKSEGYREIYLLWYWDPDAYNRGFEKVFQSGPMKLYRYIEA